MKVAIYGRRFEPVFSPYYKTLIDLLVRNKVKIFFYKRFLEFIEKEKLPIPENIEVCSREELINKSFDFLFSVGGDGTFLEAVPMVHESHIPIIGINSGRLGFLANIAKEDIEAAVNELFKGQFIIEERSLLHAKLIHAELDFFPHALNEVTIQKTDNSLLSIHLYLDDEFAATYWSDGLIISSPTGSTAYSLSVGGPIIAPNTDTFIISPIASHNLTVRPLIISDQVKLKLKIDARNDQFLLTVDNRSVHLCNMDEIIIEKSINNVRMLNFTDSSFYKTLRTKLMWGADKRN
jgi:NAD+ kinase